MTNKTPLVSIGMPVFNGGKYLEEALLSLQRQTLSDFELIISDNASTDNTQDICRFYVTRDSRIRYIRHSENIGPLANFQHVLSEASGKYFMWAAHDDRWHPDFIKRLTLTLDSNPESALSFSNYIVKNLDTGSESFHQVSNSKSDSLVR